MVVKTTTTTTTTTTIVSTMSGEFHRLLQQRFHPSMVFGSVEGSDKGSGLVDGGTGDTRDGRGVDQYLYMMK